tara:strand:- start:244 stop:705 length:462 start_codon:yes stop_codon:yes gene_type:complete
LIIESVAAAGLILKQISDTVAAVNEGRASIESAMGLIADFGSGLNEFQQSRATGFRPLSNGDILKLSMLRRSQERYETDLRNIMLVMDSRLLEQYDQMVAENRRKHREHQALMAKKKRQREKLQQQIAVGLLTLIIGGGICLGLFVLVIKAFG